MIGSGYLLINDLCPVHYKNYNKVVMPYYKPLSSVGNFVEQLTLCLKF